ncbi:hypothetical protein [Pseudoalteromonas rubra]|nr:hypothetical protein [Pseudoalteromonas rubra]
MTKGIQGRYRTLLRMKQVVLVYCCVFMTACQLVPVASYEPEVRNLLVRTSVEVDFFWRNMRSIDVSARQFERFSKMYTDIEKDIMAIRQFNLLRENNSESIRQSEILLELWRKDRASHQSSNGFSNFKIKRRLNEYQRVFNAMMAGESAKI